MRARHHTPRGRLLSLALALAFATGCGTTVGDDADSSMSKGSATVTDRSTKAAAEDLPAAWCGLRNWPLPLCPEENAPFLDGVLTHRGPAAGDFPEVEATHDYEFWADQPIYNGGTRTLGVTVTNLDVVSPESRESRRVEALGKQCGVHVSVDGVDADACSDSAGGGPTNTRIDPDLVMVRLTWERDGKVFEVSAGAVGAFTPEELAAAVTEWPYDAKVWGPVRSSPDDITNAVWLLMGDGARNFSDKVWGCLIDTIGDEVGPDPMHAYEASGLNAPVTDPELAQQLGEIVVGCVDEPTFISVALLDAYAPDSTEVSCIVDKLSPEQYLELTVSGLMRDASGAGPLQVAAADCLPA